MDAHGDPGPEPRVLPAVAAARDAAGEAASNAVGDDAGLAAGDAADSTPAVRDLLPADLDEVRRIDAAHRSATADTQRNDALERFLGDARPGRVALAALLPARRTDRALRLAGEPPRPAGETPRPAGEPPRLAGFLVGEVRTVEFGSPPCGWIIAVGVDPACARLGVASALLALACRRFGALGVRLVRTMVERNDVPFLAFFRANGFVGGPYVQLEHDLRDTRRRLRAAERSP